MFAYNHKRKKKDTILLEMYSNTLDMDITFDGERVDSPLGQLALGLTAPGSTHPGSTRPRSTRPPPLFFHFIQISFNIFRSFG